MNRKILFSLIAILTLCICLVLAGTGLVVLQAPNLGRLIGAAPSPTSARVITLPSGATPLPATPLPSISTSTYDALQRTIIPPRDLYQIVPRLSKNPDLAKPIPTPAAPRARKVGDKEAIYVVEDQASGRYRTMTATLQTITPNGYFWTEDGLNIDRGALLRSADFWEQQIFPTNIKYFGTVGRGLDGDARVHVMNTKLERGTAGYFSSVDTHPRILVPFSNERNVVYMDAVAVPPGKDEYYGVLAHEFQHLIHHYQGTAKTGWIDEGMGDLAIKVNGFPVLGVMDTFARNYNTQLNTWADSPQASAAHYAASYLFFNYVANRYGAEFIRDVIHAPREGILGVQAVLDQRANGLKFDALFAEWAVTNYLNDANIENGKYSYPNEKNFRVSRLPSIDSVPSVREQSMWQYAASYLTLAPDNLPNVTLYFTGTTTAKLIAENPHGGKWMWYSNRADLSNMTLTRQFDLSKTTKATLQFWTWYDIEQSYDYAYVEASTDSGKTWDILKGKTTTTDNPNGASYGEAFTGKSGGWIQEQVDLTPYAGKSILIRFEYITDDAYNTPGWAIDDVAIPEINYADDVETGEGGWQAGGFIRTDNVLPQKYIVQVVVEGSRTKIERMQLDAQNRGNLTVSGLGADVSRVVLVVTAHAPTTTEPTQYQVGIASK